MERSKMREIKFRAWHKQDGYMILPEHCERFDINFTPKGYDGFSFDIRYTSLYPPHIFLCRSCPLSLCIA